MTGKKEILCGNCYLDPGKCQACDKPFKEDGEIACKNCEGRHFHMDEDNNCFEDTFSFTTVIEAPGRKRPHTRKATA